MRGLALAFLLLTLAACGDGYTGEIDPDADSADYDQVVAEPCDLAAAAPRDDCK